MSFTNRECRKLLIIERHGDRNPMKGIGDIRWPSSDDFWSKHSATLTPEGVLESYDIGAWFKEDYPIISQLPPNRVYCYSSNLNRTIMTSWSILNGWFPQYGKTITMNQFYDRDTIDICISDIFHHSKMYEDLRVWQKENKRNSPELQRLSEDEQYIDISSKLHKYYQIPDDYPSNVEKLIHTKALYTQYVINRYHNQGDLILSDDEVKRLREISRLCHKYRFVDSSQRVDRQKGYIVSSSIIDVISEFLDDPNDNLTILSGHDTTLFSLASIFGIDIDMPSFNGMYIIEDYDDHISFKYIRNPREIDHRHESSKRWSKEAYYLSYEDLDEGIFTREEFYDLLSF